MSKSRSNILDIRYAIKVAKYHRDKAYSKELRRYWVRVIIGLKEKKRDMKR